MKMNLKQDYCVKLGIIKDTLDNDYKRHYTYSQLAQKVNTNEFKLKNGFLQQYKISFYAYLTNVPLQHQLIVMLVLLASQRIDIFFVSVGVPGSRFRASIRPSIRSIRTTINIIY